MFGPPFPGSLSAPEAFEWRIQYITYLGRQNGRIGNLENNINKLRGEAQTTTNQLGDTNSS